MPPARRVVRWLLLAVLAGVAWRSIDYGEQFEPGTDSAIFLAMAAHTSAGRVLYREVWDHKPPLIFALDAAAIRLGGNPVDAVHRLERLFAVAGVLACVLVVLLGFGRFWLAWTAGLLYLFHFYWPWVFELGNVTEEYGAVFTLLGMAAALLAVRADRPRGVLGLAAAAGAAFAAAVLCKEPFLLLAPPWLVYLAWPHAGDRRDARRRAAGFLLGALLPGLLFLGYLLRHGAWADWLDVLAFNLHNRAGAVPLGAESWLGRLLRMADSKLFGTLLLTRVAALLGLAALLHWSWVRRREGLPLVLAATAALGLYATSLGGGYSGHYYLFLVPSYVLLGAAGVAWLLDQESRPLRLAAGPALLLLLGAGAPALRGYAERLADRSPRWPGLPLGTLIEKYTDPGDPLWAPWNALLYTTSGRYAPTRWLFAFDHLFVDTPGSTQAEKYALLRAELAADPPRVIVVNAPPGNRVPRAKADSFLVRSGLAEWIAEHYRTVLGSREGPVQLLLSKGFPPAESAAAHEGVADLLAAGRAALEREQDPLGAVFSFQRALDRAPGSVEASSQLAGALDAVGQSAEARRAWAEAYRIARRAGDGAALARARARLLRPDAETVEGWMAAGLDCLYVLGDGAAAAGFFRRVLALKPAHYGANFQLARALDLSGRKTEARARWRVVLGLAQAGHDSVTADLARGRLAQN